MISIRKPLDRQTYIANLKIASTFLIDKTLGTEPLHFYEDQEDAKVVDGSTVSFLSGIPIQQQQDVLNSTLLAQLAANYEFDRELETENWYGKYHEVLENIGWISDAYYFESQSNPGSTIQLDTESLDVVRTIASGNELTLLTKTLESLDEVDPDSKAATLFNDGGSTGSGGNFQLGTASLDENKNIVLTSGAFYFSANEHQNRFLFVTWVTKDINFYAGVQRIILNEAIYATVRQAVIDNLGEAAQTYVANLPIKI